MILLVGNHHDDVLYFESKLRNKKVEVLFDKFHFVTGTMFSQNIGILYGGYTNYLNALLVQHVISKNYTILVINVGKCTAVTNEYANGDMAICRRVYFGGVDMLGVENASIGQIPNLPPHFVSDPYVLNLITNSFNRISSIDNAPISTFISLDKKVQNIEELQDISIGDMFFGTNKNIVIDNSAAGVALACYLHNIPFISAKVVEHKLGQKTSIESYVKLLKRYSDLGKAITSFIGEVSRNEVITGNEAAPE